MGGGGYVCAIRRDQMVSVSEAMKTLSKQIDKVSKGEEIFILKNNSAKAVLMGVDEYEHLCYLAEIAERLEVAQLIEERKNADRSKDVDLEDFLSDRGL